MHSNKSNNNLLKNNFVSNSSVVFQNTKSAPKNKIIFTDENNKETNEDNNNENGKMINSEKFIINFSTRENMARNKLMLNLRKVENYKRELEQVKSNRNCFGTINTGYVNSPNQRSTTPYKPTKSLVTKITHDMTEDELVIYWVNMTIKYKGNIPSFLKPIGLTREQKKKIERLTQGMGKTNKNKSMNVGVIEKNENQNITFKENKMTNDYSKIKTNKSVKFISPTKTKKMYRSNDKVVLPKLK